MEKTETTIIVTFKVNEQGFDAWLRVSRIFSTLLLPASVRIESIKEEKEK